MSSSNLTRPVAYAVAVTPSDTTDLTTLSRGLQIDGAAGAVKVMWADGSTTTFSNLLVGYPYPYQVRRVYSTGTAATSILALY